MDRLPLSPSLAVGRIEFDSIPASSIPLSKVSGIVASAEKIAASVIKGEDIVANSITTVAVGGGDGDGQNPKEKFGVAKPAFGMIPSTALTHLAVVHALGAAKYGPYNWRETKVSAMTYVSAAERHLRSWLDGEHIDPESGASHLAHVMACCAILIDAAEVGTLADDRPIPAPTAELIARLTKKVLN